MDNNGYVFISYSSQNQQIADSFRQLLKEEKIECWMAPYDIPAGSKYAYVINDALENCTCVVLLLTNASQSSQFVEREVERAITYKKPIIPLQMEDLELNSGFKFYIGSSQIIAVPEIRHNSPAVNQAISGIRNFLLPVPVSPRINAYVHHTLQAQSCRVTVWSPVNVDVFLNNKRRLVLKVDHYSGFDYSSNTITAAGEFTLIFSSKGFEKEILFDMPPNGKINYHLKNILTTDEIIASYDREDAIMHMKTNPTAYSFEQLGAVGNLEDIDLLEESLTTLSSGMTESDQHKNYLIAVCAFSLGKLCIKYSSFENVDTIAKIYDKYPAKMQYGYYFDNILKELTSSDEKYRKLYSAKGITGSRCKDKKSDIVSDPDLEHTGQSSELCDGQDVLRNAADLPPTPDEAFMFRYDEKNAGWSISLRYDKYTEIKIPDKYQGRLVTDIGSEAFKYCGSLTNVTIPSSVTSIGECAFYGCESLTNITIPSSVTIIGKKAFYGCKSLPSITIPSNVRIIEDYAFAGCCNLTRITIPSGIPVFGVCVFRRCGKLKKIIWLQNNDKEKQMRLEEFYQKLGRCRHCGGPFKKDLFSIKCKFCGDKKDY